MGRHGESKANVLQTSLPFPSLLHPHHLAAPLHSDPQHYRPPPTAYRSNSAPHPAHGSLLPVRVPSVPAVTILAPVLVTITSVTAVGSESLGCASLLLLRPCTDSLSGSGAGSCANTLLSRSALGLGRRRRGRGLRLEVVGCPLLGTGRSRRSGRRGVHTQKPVETLTLLRSVARLLLRASAGLRRRRRLGVRGGTAKAAETVCGLLVEWRARRRVRGVAVGRLGRRRVGLGGLRDRGGRAAGCRLTVDVALGHRVAIALVAWGRSLRV